MVITDTIFPKAEGHSNMDVATIRNENDLKIERSFWEAIWRILDIGSEMGKS